MTWFFLHFEFLVLLITQFFISVLRIWQPVLFLKECNKHEEKSLRRKLPVLLASAGKVFCHEKPENTDLLKLQL